MTPPLCPHASCRDRMMDGMRIWVTRACVAASAGGRRLQSDDRSSIQFWTVQSLKQSHVIKNKLKRWKFTFNRSRPASAATFTRLHAFVSPCSTPPPDGRNRSYMLPSDRSITQRLFSINQRANNSQNVFETPSKCRSALKIRPDLVPGCSYMYGPCIFQTQRMHENHDEEE